MPLKVTRSKSMSSFFDLVASLQASIDSLDKILAGGDSETVLVDGVNKDTISKAIKDKFSAIQAMVQGSVTYETKALMDAAGAPPANVLAKVWNDTKANNGLYGYKDNAWIKSDYDNVQALVSRVEALENSPFFEKGALPVFESIKHLQLFNTDKSKYYSVKYYFFNDSGVRFNFSVYQSDDKSGAGAVVVCEFKSSNQVYSGYEEFVLNETADSGITGTLVVDFDNVSGPFSFYGPNHSGSAIRTEALFNSQAQKANENKVINAAVEKIRANEGKLKLPFSAEMNNSYLRMLVKNVSVYGAKPGHNYLVYPKEIKHYRRTWVLRDITDGVDIAQFRETVALDNVSPDYSSQPRYWKLTQDALPTYSGTYAVIEVDWSKAITGDTAYTAPEQGGIHADNIYTDYRIADYLDSDHYHEVIKVGSNEAYATLRLAVESLYWPGTKMCARAHYNHRILIHIVEAGTFNATDLEIPEWVEVKGLSWQETKIIRENTNSAPVLQAHHSTKTSDCEILSESDEYCIHSDDFNRLSRDPESNNKSDWPRTLRQSFKNMRLVGGDNQKTWLFGCGVSSGQTILFDDVYAEHQAVLPNNPSSSAFGFHNTGPTVGVPDIARSERGGKVILRNCQSPDLGGQGVYLQSLGGEGTAKSLLVLESSIFGLIKQDVVTSEVIVDLAKDRFEWQVSGVYDGAIWFNDPDCLVLSTTPNVAVSGSAASILFGTIDELGHGEKWIKDATVKSLGARLGDCSSANKTLDIAGQVHTFNTNLTLLNNATIIGQINASITNNPVAEVNIATEFFPDTGFSFRAKNTSGVTLSQGRFVTRLSDGTIKLCGENDKVFGWLPRSILNNRVGKVVTSKQISSAYINGASVDGEFGLSANGELDYGAATKVGIVQNAIVSLYR